MKKIVLMGIIIVLTIIIYFCFNDNKILYVNIGDDILYKYNYQNDVINYLKKNKNYENYIEYRKENYRITDFVNDIEQNTLYKDNKTVKNLLIKADIITLWVGTNDIYYKINETDSNQLYHYLDDVLEDMENLFDLLRKNSKEKIIVMGINHKNPDKLEYFAYFNQKLNELCNEYNMDFVDTNNKNKSLISNEIIKKIKK